VPISCVQEVTQKDCRWWQIRPNMGAELVSEAGLEPARPCGHQPLKLPRSVFSIQVNDILPGSRIGGVFAVKPFKSGSLPLVSK
jgi:hypothetical protein